MLHTQYDSATSKGDTRPVRPLVTHGPFAGRRSHRLFVDAQHTLARTARALSWWRDGRSGRLAPVALVTYLFRFPCLSGSLFFLTIPGLLLHSNAPEMLLFLSCGALITQCAQVSAAYERLAGLSIFAVKCSSTYNAAVPACAKRVCCLIVDYKNLFLI